MSNIIPPLVSNSPPPPPSEEDEDDEYDDFRGSNDISYGCDSFSLTPSPEQTPKKLPKGTSVSEEPEFNFTPVSPETVQELIIENLHVDSFKIEENNPDNSKHKIDGCSKESSESFDNSSEDISSSKCQENNVVNSDNIPSQFIIESKNFKHENDAAKCDNSDTRVEKLSKDLHELHIEDKKQTIREIHISNGFSELKTQELESTSEICNSRPGWSTDVDLPLSNDTYFITSNESLTKIVQNLEEDEYGDFSEVSRNEQFEFPTTSTSIDAINIDKENCRGSMKKEDKTDHFSAYPVHSTQNNSNIILVKDETLEIHATGTKEVGITEIISESKIDVGPDSDSSNNKDTIAKTTSPSIINNSKDEDEDDFCTFVSHPLKAHVSLDLEQISKSECDYLENNIENEVLKDAADFNPENSVNTKQIEQESVQTITKSLSKLEDFQPVFSDENLNDNEDEFANFSSFRMEGQQIVLIENESFDAFSSKSVDERRDTEGEESENNFANFASFSVNQQSESNCDNIAGDVFDSFTSFSVMPDSTDTKDSQISDDDFGEFTSTTIEPSTSFTSGLSGESSKTFLLLDEKEAFRKTEEIVKDIFALSEETFNDIQYFELGKGDFIFTQLQDVTETPALGYTWSKSTSQKLLLKALNIDSRNILYGHSWNPSVPRFAANLGVQPLEPVKMDTITSTPFEPSSSTAQTSQPEPADVPSAQFDWTGSGLVNPLDYSPTGSSTQISKPTSTLTPPTDSDDYAEFTAFQSSDVPQVPAGWPGVKLRETYISDVPQAHIDVDVCLQPTIVTPEMPRKEISTDDGISFSETTGDLAPDDNNEFDDFQVAYPVNKNVDAAVDSKTFAEEEHIKSDVIIEEKKTQDTSTNAANIPDTKNQIEDNEDDDFTEFHSSVPLPPIQPEPQLQPAILTPVLQPLQPTQVYTTPRSTQINWPDPGITQDELHRFEQAFSSSLPPRNEVMPSRESAKLEKVPVQSKLPDVVEVAPVQQRTDTLNWENTSRSKTTKPVTTEKHKKAVPKQTSQEDDEEWSDFVSVQKPSPVHKTKLKDRTQTSSPDLPLSVFNLGSIQPAKQPIPVITPRGLVQTKLSSNVNPIHQPKFVNPVNTRPSYDMPPMQPSIISNQYASQVYNVGAVPKSSQRIQNGQDDEEWGEFVSSPLPPQYQNSSTTVGHHSWNSFVPNIRSNPAHQSLYANQASSRTVSTNLQKKSSNLSGLVIPDLDFLALKERSGVPRKK